MAGNWFLAPNPVWNAQEQIGVDAASGYVFTFETGTNIPMATALDPGGVSFNTNPVRLNEAGEAIIYWNGGEDIPLYRLQVYNKRLNLIGTYDNYPVVGNGGSSNVTIYTDLSNYGRNEQFTFWLNGQTFSNDDLIVGSTAVADEWFFRRDTQAPVINISMSTFTPGSTAVPNTPIHYVHYECTTAASAVYQDFYQKYGDVQTLNNQQVTVCLQAQTSLASTESTLTLVVWQYFGTGGSPDNIITFDFDLADTWQNFLQTFVVPSVSGTVIGPGSFLAIGFRPQINQVTAIDWTNYLFQSGTGAGASNYPYETPDDQYTRILSEVLASNNPKQGTDIVGVTGKPQYANLTEFDDEIEPRNYLICADMYTNPRQFGQIQDDTTIVPNDDGTYIADGVILISDGDNVVSQNSLPGLPLVLTVVTDNRKFGFFQIVEAQIAADLFSRYASASIQIQTGNGSGDVPINWRVAIVAFAGTLGTEPRQIVTPGLWNGAAVNPTLAAGWTYLQVSGAFTSHTGSYWDPNSPTGGVNNVSIPTPTTLANFKTVGVMAWVDDPTPFTPGDLINFSRWNLTPTKAIAPVEFVGSEESAMQAQRYFQKSYPIDSTEAWGYAVPQSGMNFLNFYITPLARTMPLLSALNPPTLAIPPIINSSLTWEEVIGDFTGPTNTNVVGFYPIQNIEYSLKVPMARKPTVTLMNSFDGTSGNAYSIYVLENLSSTNPDVSVILQGATVFDDGTASSPYSPTHIPVSLESSTESHFFVNPGNIQLLYLQAFSTSGEGGTATFNFRINPMLAVEYIADALLGV